MTTVNEFTIGQRVHPRAALGALTIVLSVMIAALLAFTAVSLATLICRAIRRPICRLRYAVETPASTERAAASASIVTLAVVAPLTPVAVTHFDDTDGVPADETRQANAYEPVPSMPKASTVPNPRAQSTSTAEPARPPRPCRSRVWHPHHRSRRRRGRAYGYRRRRTVANGRTAVLGIDMKSTSF